MSALSAFPPMPSEPTSADRARMEAMIQEVVSKVVDFNQFAPLVAGAVMAAMTSILATHGLSLEQLRAIFEPMAIAAVESDGARVVARPPNPA